MFEFEEIDYSEEQKIFLESSNKKEDSKNYVLCFLSNFAPSYEDFLKNNKIKLSKKEYEKICKKANKKIV